MAELTADTDPLGPDNPLIFMTGPFVGTQTPAAGRYSERFLAAIDRALAVRPEERTQSIGEFRSDLGLGDAGFVPGYN